MSVPRFSVIIPTYNQEKLLRVTLESVLCQTFSSYEVIVVDDGSSDGTIAMLDAYRGRIRLLREKNSGADLARSKGAAVATGDYIVLLDHDDLLYANALATYDRVITALGAPPLLLGAMSYFHNKESPDANVENRSEITYFKFRDFLSKDVGVGRSNSRIVLKRSVAEATGALAAKPPAFPIDDVNLLLLAGTNGPCILIDTPYTVAYRLHSNNTIRRLGFMIDGLLALARYERQGVYPGGKSRRWQRYGVLGGACVEFVVRAAKSHEFRLATKLFLRTAPMITAAIVNRVLRSVRKPTPLSKLE